MSEDDEESETSGSEAETEGEEEEDVTEIATEPLVESDASEEGEPEGASKTVKRKRKLTKKNQPVQSTSQAKKTKTCADGEEPLLDEKKPKAKEAASKKPKAISGKKEMFNDKNCDVDLYEHDPDKIISKKIRINNSLIMSCKNMTINSPNGTQYDYPTITFAKKMRDGKSFDFHVNLSAGPQMIKALHQMIDANPIYFGKQNLAK